MKESCRQAWLSDHCHLYRQGSRGWIRRWARAFARTTATCGAYGWPLTKGEVSMMSMARTDGGALAVLADAFGEAPTTALMVRQVRWEADDVISIELTAPDGELLPEWEPGAHIDVFLESGLVRHYSLCGRTADRTRYRIAVLREPDGRGGSAEIHRDVRVGGQLTIG